MCSKCYVFIAGVQREPRGTVPVRQIFRYIMSHGKCVQCPRVNYYGAQHEYILDDRDIQEYNKTPKFEEFVHLEQNIQKLIVYSHIDTVINIDRSNMWYSPPQNGPYEPNVHGYELRITEGLNIICLCHTNDCADWPQPYKRVTVESRGIGLISLVPTPDLDCRWQALIVTDRCPLSLQETALISIGFHYIRRETDVKEWDNVDPWVERAHGTFRVQLARFRLTDAQKILLLYNSSGIHRHSCISHVSNDIGHLTQSLGAKVPFAKAFDWDFIAEHRDRYEWYCLQWESMVENFYWDSVTYSHGVVDFQDYRRDFGYFDYSDASKNVNGPDWYGELLPVVLSSWES